MIYLDNAATTPMAPEVVAAMEPYYMKCFGNPSSPHGLGKEARAAIDSARKLIADVVGCLPKDIIFTSGGSEADNLALVTRNDVITSEIEHKAVLCSTLSDEDNRVRTCINGVIDFCDLVSKIKTARVASVMAVNNETGVFQYYDLIGRICHECDVLFHTDAVQGFGHRPIHIDNVDMMSVSGHKINGPKGIGFLYANQKAQITMIPNIFGGAQEFGHRAGTEAVPLIVGLAKAVELHSNPKPYNLGWFEDRLVSECGAVINGMSCHDDEWKNIINFQLDIHNDTMIQLLSKAEIYMSAGSACNSSSSKPSHVLKAMGLTDEECNRSLRISVGDGITKEDADTVINEINRIRKEQKLFEVGLDE